jgi:hypothetical protein
VSLETPHNPSALARAVVIVPSGARVLQDRETTFVSQPPSCTGGNEARGVFSRSSIVETVGSVREELEAEHHLRVEKAHGSLRSYSAEVLGPHVGFSFA